MVQVKQPSLITLLDSSIAAGILITIGAAVNLTIGGIAGAALFCVGLASILHFHFDLYTGKAGLVVWKEISIPRLLLVLLGNFFGATMAGLILSQCNPDLSVVATKLWETRLQVQPLIILAKSVFCGMLMYIAVTAYKANQKIEFVILPVMVFILAGFYHSIADMAYAAIANIKVRDAWPILITIAGNFIGCNLMAICHWSRITE